MATSLLSGRSGMAHRRRAILFTIVLTTSFLLPISVVLNSRFSIVDVARLYRRADVGNDPSSHDSHTLGNPNRGDQPEGGERSPGTADVASNNELTWQQYIERGQQLDDLTMYSAHGTPQSEWTTQDLVRHGWKCTWNDVEVADFQSHGSAAVKSALMDLGLSTFFDRPLRVGNLAYYHEVPHLSINVAPSQNMALKWGQPIDWAAPLNIDPNQKVCQTWSLDEKPTLTLSFEPIYTTHSFVYNPTEGVLVAAYSVSWAEATAELPEGVRNQLSPPTDPWHEIAFQGMEGMCRREYTGMDICDIKNLKYVFWTNIRSWTMINILNHALSTHLNRNGGPTQNPDLATLNHWSWNHHQRATFSPETDAGKAIIGSPIGTEVAMLLIRHKVQLGVKRIKSITLFRDDNPDKVVPVLLFEIEDPSEDKGRYTGFNQAQN